MVNCYLVEMLIYYYIIPILPCVYFHNQCKIYQKRPSQCVRFPFWEDYKEDFNDLLKECIGVVKK